MIRTMYCNGKGSCTTDLKPTLWRTTLRDPDGVLWVDYGGEAPETVEPQLRDIFGFHQLAIDDALRETHLPRIDNWGSYAYVVVHGVTFQPETLGLEVHEVDIFLGRNFIVTHHVRPSSFVDRVWSASVTDARRVERGADFLLYELLDFLAADYMPVVDALEDTIDEIEDQVFERPTPRIVNTIFSVKRAALQMRRIISPMREVLNRLARDEYAMIDPQDRVYFRDVYDHMVRLADVNEALRDLIGGALETYLSVTSNRTNDIMKVLTIISALFMPIAFLSGFFGMNFTNIPFDSPWLLAIALSVMVATPVAMLVWFRRLGWL